MRNKRPGVATDDEIIASWVDSIIQYLDEEYEKNQAILDNNEKTKDTQ